MKTKQLIYFIENRASFRAYSAGQFKVGAQVKVVGFNGSQYENGQRKIDGVQAEIVAIDGDKITVKNDSLGEAVVSKSHLAPRAKDGEWEDAWIALLNSPEAKAMMEADLEKVAELSLGHDKIAMTRDGGVMSQTGVGQDGHSIIGDFLGRINRASIRVHFVLNGGNPFESEYLVHRDAFLKASLAK